MPDKEPKFKNYPKIEAYQMLAIDPAEEYLYLRDEHLQVWRVKIERVEEEDVQ